MIAGECDIQQRLSQSVKDWEAAEKGKGLQFSKQEAGEYFCGLLVASMIEEKPSRVFDIWRDWAARCQQGEDLVWGLGMLSEESAVSHFLESLRSKSCWGRRVRSVLSWQQVVDSEECRHAYRLGAQIAKNGSCSVQALGECKQLKYRERVGDSMAAIGGDFEIPTSLSKSVEQCEAPTIISGPQFYTRTDALEYFFGILAASLIEDEPELVICLHSQLNESRYCVGRQKLIDILEGEASLVCLLEMLRSTDGDGQMMRSVMPWGIFETAVFDNVKELGWQISRRGWCKIEDLGGM